MEELLLVTLSDPNLDHRPSEKNLAIGERDWNVQTQVCFAKFHSEAVYTEWQLWFGDIVMMMFFYILKSVTALSIGLDRPTYFVLSNT